MTYPPCRSHALPQSPPLFLTAPLSSAAVVFHRGPREKLLRYGKLATSSDIPPEAEWFANLRNRHTREHYARDIRQFIAFAGLGSVDQLREVTRPHVLAWRDHLHGQGLANDTIRRKLAALSSLYDYLCNRHAVLHNPVLGVRRPPSMNREGRRRRSGTTRRCFCWRPRRPERAKASATGRCWPCSSLMASGGRSSAG